MSFRVGFGYDVHQFEGGRKLLLGGVQIPFDKGLKGHSDADVLLHAITDAILGAAAMGDIGTLFPDSDSAYKNADSALLLANAYKKVKEGGWRLVNIDSTVIAELPKLQPWNLKIRERIAEILSLKVSSVSLKATTNEAMGFVGRGEGIAVHAVVLLESVN